MTNSQSWVSMWGNAMSISDHKPATYAKNLTLRYPIYCPFFGNSIRITFDNYCGLEPVTISKATVFYKDVFHTLSFAGSNSVTIGAKENAVSDELPLEVQAEDSITVSFYLADYTEMRSSVVAIGPLSSGTYAVGDQTEIKDISIDISRKTDVFYFLSNVSILTNSVNHAVVAYGDSITAQDWPDYLTLLLKEQDIDNTSIIRRATSGSRILREYDNITYESYGLKGTNRFEHEVPTDGADIVIIQQGINDIIHPVGTDVNPFRPMSDLPTVTELVSGLKYYIECARKYGYRVYVGTLLPIKGWRTYAPFRDELRNAYNEWIRNSDLIDGFIDFDLALRDPDDSAAFLPIYDSGDHLHPSKAGYKRMAEEAFKILFK